MAQYYNEDEFYNFAMPQANVNTSYLPTIAENHYLSIDQRPITIPRGPWESSNYPSSSRMPCAEAMYQPAPMQQPPNHHPAFGYHMESKPYASQTFGASADFERLLPCNQPKFEQQNYSNNRPDLLNIDENSPYDRPRHGKQILHIYNAGTGIDYGIDGIDRRDKDYTPSMFGRFNLKQKRLQEKRFNGNKPTHHQKFNMENTNLPDDNDIKDEDFDDVELIQKRLQAGKYEPVYNFLEVVAELVAVSEYAMEMHTERIGLHYAVTGHVSDDEYYLPITMTSINSHIEQVHPALCKELFEITSLIDSIKTLDLDKENETNVRKNFIANLNYLADFGKIKIKQKNGELLLPQEKITNLQTMIQNLITCVQYYALYLAVSKFVYEKNRDAEENKENVLPLEQTSIEQGAVEVGKLTENLANFDLCENNRPNRPLQPFNRRENNKRSVGF